MIRPSHALGPGGPLYLRRWFTREPIDSPFIDPVVRGVPAGIGAR